MSDENSQRDGWHEYSRLVLSKLDTLESSVLSLREEMQTFRKEMVTYGNKQEVSLAEQISHTEKIEELRAWKKDVDAVATPQQLRDTLKENKQNRDFTIRATSMLVMLQVIIGIAISVYMKK